MVSNLYLNDLSKRSRKGDIFARWRLGELLFEAEQEGYRIVIDKDNEIIQVFERCSDG